jgi:hypothetical protein
MDLFLRRLLPLSLFSLERWRDLDLNNWLSALLNSIEHSAAVNDPKRSQATMGHSTSQI